MEGEEKTVFFLLMIETEEDRRKFILLYKEYEHLLYWVAWDMVQDNYEAEDLVHDAFEKIANHMDKIDEPISEEAKRYLYAVIRNTVLDHIRKEQREKRFQFMPLHNVQVADPGALPAFEEAEEENRVLEAIKRLPERYSSIFLLKYVQELDYKEIAEMLDMKESTVRQRIARGKELLRVELEKIWKEEK